VSELAGVHSTSTEARVASAFSECFGSAATLLVTAPGRVNLLGEHTDYNGGFVLPMALQQQVWIALRPRPDRRVVVHLVEDGNEPYVVDLDGLRHARGWMDYLLGTAWALREAGIPLCGWDGVVVREIPLGAGLSSSAALEIAAVRAFLALARLGWDPVQAARLGQRAENEWVGVQCGIMDQLIVAAAREGHALLIDCRDLRTRPVPLPPRTVAAVLDTSTRRGLMESAYNDRRARCEAVARSFDVASLRDLELADLERRRDRLPEADRLLARHVITENARTLDAADALARGDPARAGILMGESHRSLRDDFGVSSPALDAMVAAAQAAKGCYGARMTGAGFGGCAVALVDEAASAAFVESVGESYKTRTGLTAVISLARPGAGAIVRRLD
jgi:galactokinase